MWVEFLFGDLGGVWDVVEIGFEWFFEFVIGFGFFKGGFEEVIGGMWILELWFSGKNGVE